MLYRKIVSGANSGLVSRSITVSSMAIGDVTFEAVKLEDVTLPEMLAAVEQALDQNGLYGVMYLPRLMLQQVMIEAGEEPAKRALYNLITTHGLCLGAL